MTLELVCNEAVQSRGRGPGIRIYPSDYSKDLAYGNIESHLDAVGGAEFITAVAHLQKSAFHQLPVADSHIESTVAGHRPIIPVHGICACIPSPPALFRRVGPYDWRGT